VNDVTNEAATAGLEDPIPHVGVRLRARVEREAEAPAEVSVDPATRRHLGPWVRWGLLLLLAGLVATAYLWPAAPDAGPGDRGRQGPRPTPVSVAPVETGPLAARAVYHGELDADGADVATAVSGRIVEVTVRLGDPVEAGQLIARIDVAEVNEQRAEARAEVEAARASLGRANVELATARRELTRAQRLAEQGALSAQALEQRRAAVDGLAAEGRLARAQISRSEARVELLERRIEESFIRAPFDGVIAHRRLDPGGFAQAGQALARVVATSPLRVRFEVPERDVGLLAPGAGVTVRAASTAQAEARARVSGIGGEVDRERRTVLVEAILDDPPPGWLPGMFAEVTAVRRSIEDATVVPAAAVLSRLEADGEVRSGVMRHVDGRARWVPVEVLARDGDRVAVAGEVAEGAEVMIGGHADLVDGGAVLVSDVGAR